MLTSRPVSPDNAGWGDIDLFATENAEYAKRLNGAGVQCEHIEVKGVPHAFEAVCPDADISKGFVASAIGFLKTAYDQRPD
ncbi:MAG: alpha/beta hydrolase fold domain-containing protein [Pseudomonadota bacterium]